MPNLDKTGPMGKGAMTGRRMGSCTNMGVQRSQQIEDNERIENQLNRNPQGEGAGRGRRRRMRGGVGGGAEEGLRQNRRMRTRMGRGGREGRPGGRGRGLGFGFRGEDTIE